MRVYDTVTLDSVNADTGRNFTLTGQGASAMCMYCHNARRSPFQLSGGKAYYLGAGFDEAFLSELAQALARKLALRRSPAPPRPVR